MISGLKTIIYPVSDIGAAKAFYTELFGVEPYVDAPYYVAFNAAGHDVGLDPQGHAKGLTGPTPYWHVSDINASLNEQVAAGATVLQQPTDVGAGNMIATIKDMDGNVTGIIQAAG